MRNLKKYLAVIITVAMMFTLMVPAFAVEGFSYETEAQTLNDLGLYKGISTETFEPDLGTALNRETGVTLLVRLMGLEADALALTDAEVEAALAGYTDVAEVSDWAKPYMAYAVTNGLVKGVTETTLAAKDALLGKAYATLVLRAMGYDPDYNSAAVELSNKGGLSTTEALKFNDKALTKDDLVGISFGSLKATYADGKTIIEVLVEKGAVAEAAAIAAGVIAAATPEPVSEDLEIASVKALNQVQMEVVFTKEVDSETAGDEDNYELSDDAVVTDASLQDDNMTVVLTIDLDDTTDALDPVDQQGTLDVTVTDVEDLDGNAIAETTIEDIEFLDTTLPKALSAEVVGNDTVKVTFSEPIMSVEGGDPDLKDAFTVNGGDDKVKDVSKQANDTEVLVVLYTDLEEGTITVKVDGDAEDYAGFGVIAKTFDVEVVEDTEAPVVVDYEDADLNGVTLIFNEDIEIAATPTLANFYHTNSKNPATGVKVDGNKLTLDFTNNNLPEGTAYVYIAKENVNDLWDNDNDKIVAKIEVEVDTTKPELDELSVEDEDEIKLTFTEDLDDVDVDNFTILDKDGEEVEDIIDSAEFDTNSDGDIKDTVIITFTEDLSGDYSIVIEDLLDTADNEIDKVTEDFTVTDVTSPDLEDDTDDYDVTATLYNAGDEDQMVKIDFDQEMAVDGKYSVLDLDKYEIDGNVLSELDCDVTIKAVDDNTAVEIVIPSEADDEDDGVDITSGPDKVTIARIADAAGNVTAVLSSTIDLDAEGTLGFDSIEATDTDKIVVTFDEAVDFEEDDLLIAVADSVYLEIAKIRIGTNDDGNTTVTYTIDKELNYDGTYTSVEDAVYSAPVKIVVAATGTKNEYGEKLATSTYATSTNTVDDKIAPVLATVKVDGDDADDIQAAGQVVTLTFEEDIRVNTVSVLTFEVEDCDIESVSVVGNKINLTIASGDVPTEGLKVTQNLKFKDDNGNEVTGISGEIVTPD